MIIDGVNITDINLQASRRSMAVITQDPVLFSGTLRSNLDPYGVHEEADLWNALEQVRMNSIVQSLQGKLDFKVKESGSNFSVGERQLILLCFECRSPVAEYDSLILNDDNKQKTTTANFYDQRSLISYSGQTKLVLERFNYRMVKLSIYL